MPWAFLIVLGHSHLVVRDLGVQSPIERLLLAKEKMEGG
jgi:hypothetical protein